MKKVVYVGIFGGQNIGDLVISNQINKYLENERLSVDLIDFITLQKVEMSNTKINFTNNTSLHRNIKKMILSKKITAGLYPRNDGIISKTYSIYKEITANYFNSNAFDEYARSIEECDFVCIGGGNLLMTLGTNLWAIKINKLVSIAKKKRKKVFIISVGAGPILSKKAQKLFSGALNKADYITVRDENSKKILEDMLNVRQNVEVSGDPALLLDTVRVKSVYQKKTNIAISIMPFGKRDFFNLKWYEDSHYYIKMYENLITQLHKKNPNFVFSLFSSVYSDYEIMMHVEKRIKDVGKKKGTPEIKVVYVKSLEDLLEFYKKQDLLIGTRMHSLIIAYTQLVPIIAISWQEKVTGLMNFLNLSQYCYDLNSVNEKLDQIYINVDELINRNKNCSEKLFNVKRNFAIVTNSILEDLKRR